MPRCSEQLCGCLYFTANELARRLGKMADAAFKKTGLSPSHGLMLLLINEQPGMTQKELSEHLGLAPSTLTRFADKLVYQGLIERSQKGKIVRMYPTRDGMVLRQPIQTAWEQLGKGYSAILGDRQAADMARTISRANHRLNDLG